MIITDHRRSTTLALLARARLIVDTRNALKGRDSRRLYDYRWEYALGASKGLASVPLTKA